MYKRAHISAILLAIITLYMIGSASAALTFKGNPAACAWYHDTSISNPFTRSGFTLFDPQGSRGTYVYDSIDVFARSNNDQLIRKHYTPSGGWSNWELLSDSIMASSPAVIQFGSNNIWVTFKAIISGQKCLYLMNWDGHQWRRANYGSLPGGDNQPDEAPAITSSSALVLDVFITRWDGTLWHKVLPSGSDWELIGMPSNGPLTSAPAAGSWSEGRMDVVVRGQGNAYYHTWSDGGRPWSNWDNLGGVFTSAPGVSAVPMFRGGGGQLGLGVGGRGTNGAVYGNGLHPGTTINGWISLGGVIASASAPTLINYIGDHATIFVRGMDNTLWYLDYDLGCCDDGDYFWEQVPDATTTPLPTVTYVPSLEQDTDRPGMDINSFSLSSPNPSLCQQACFDNPDCRAFTYVRPGYQGSDAMCWLKNGIPDPVSDECCTSGTRS